MTFSVREADPATLRILDAVVVLWVVLWLAIAGAAAYSVWELAQLGQTMISAGQALDSAGRGLQRVGELPVVGPRPRTLGGQVRETSVQVIDNGRLVGSQIHRLAVLSALAMFFIPVTPVIGGWAPARLRRRRETRDLRRAVAEHYGEAGLMRFLAARAVDRLPYSTLRTVTDNPYQDLAEGRWERLATLELGRMGLSGSAPSGSSPRVAPPQPQA